MSMTMNSTRYTSLATLELNKIHPPTIQKTHMDILESTDDKAIQNRPYPFANLLDNLQE